jgi:hypothetical protein
VVAAVGGGSKNGSVSWALGNEKTPEPQQASGVSVTLNYRFEPLGVVSGSRLLPPSQCRPVVPITGIIMEIKVDSVTVIVI